MTSGAALAETHPLYIDETACKAYADAKEGYTFSVITETVNPPGCFVQPGTVIYFNKGTSTGSCGNEYDSDCIQKSPYVAVTATAAELNKLDGIANTLTTAELNVMDGVTSSTDDLNLMDGVAVTTDDMKMTAGSDAGNNANERIVTRGATTDLGTLLPSELKVPKDKLHIGNAPVKLTAAELNVLDGIHADLVVGDINKLKGLTSTTTELNKMDGVTISTADFNTLGDIAVQIDANGMITVQDITVSDNLMVPKDKLHIGGTAVTTSAAELNKMSTTSSKSELNILTGIESDLSAAEINLISSITADVDDLNLLVDKVVKVELTGFCSDATEASEIGCLIESCSNANTTNATLCVEDGDTWGPTNTWTPYKRVVLKAATIDEAKIQTLKIIDKEVLASPAELNKLSGLGLTTADLNKVTGLTSSTTELNILDGATVSTADINMLAAKVIKIGNATTVIVLNDVTFNDLDAGTFTLNGVEYVASSWNTAAGAAITTSAAELNLMNGVNATTADFNKLTGMTSTKADLDTISTAKILLMTGTDVVLPNISSSSTSDIYVTTFEIDGESINATAAEMNRIPNLPSIEIMNKLENITATSGELNLLDGATVTTEDLNLLKAKALFECNDPSKTSKSTCTGCNDDRLPCVSSCSLSQCSTGWIRNYNYNQS